MDEIFLGVDEHSFSGHDMILIITELKTKQLIAVLPKITKESLDSWLVKMSFVKADDIIKLGKIPKKLTKKDIDKINKNSNKNEVMKKYKEKALQRLKSEDINPKMLVNKKGFKIEYNEITLDYFLETGYRKLFLTREKKSKPFSKT